MKQKKEELFDSLSYLAQRLIITAAIAFGVLQAFIIFETIRYGIAFQYVTIFSGIFALACFVNEYGAARRKWVYIGVPVALYSLFIVITLMFPLYAALFFVDFIDGGFDSMIEIVQKNANTISYIKSLSIAAVPDQLSPEKDGQASIIYSFALMTYATMISVIFGIPHGTQLSKPFVQAYLKAKRPIVGLIISAGIIGAFIPYTFASNDYGFEERNVMSIHGPVQMVTYANQTAKDDLFFLAGIPLFVIPAIGAFVGFFRYLFIRKSNGELK